MQYFIYLFIFPKQTFIFPPTLGIIFFFLKATWDQQFTLKIKLKQWTFTLFDSQNPTTLPVKTETPAQSSFRQWAFFFFSQLLFVDLKELSFGVNGSQSKKKKN